MYSFYFSVLNKEHVSLLNLSALVVREKKN